MMKKIMVRNRLEILSKKTMNKPIVDYVLVVFSSRLTTWLKKYNYREYMKKIVIGYNPLKKVLLRLSFYKGSVNLIIWLVCKFLNLVKRNMNFFKTNSLIKPRIMGFIDVFNQVCVFVYFAIFLVNFGLKR